MCGITGFLNASQAADESHGQLIQNMTDTLRLRGPDASGVWLGDGAALGHRRLSILDLSPAGAQPMISLCTRFVIAFNGEIYNHLEMRRDLEVLGVAAVWSGHSDTETLLVALSHWGLDETLQRAAGMFAIALWDRREKRLSLARDRMGEKPLYWGWAGRTLVFGSELKALRVHPEFPKDVCRQAVAQYLRFSYVPAPRSIHPGIYKLEPGCILDVENSFTLTPPNQPLRPGEKAEGVSIRRYWSQNEIESDYDQSQFSSEDQSLEALDKTLKAAVSKQMISDVPLGAFLSGGVDSSLIVALMQDQSGRPVKTFTVGFEDTGFDESRHAAAVAKHLGTDHTALTVTETETRNVIPDLSDLYDEPFADPSQIPTHLICRAARKSVTVALSGDAADELFGGYNRYFWGPRIWNRLQRIPSPMRKVLGGAITSIPVAGWNHIGDLQQRFKPGTEGVSRLGEKTHKLAQSLKYVDNIDDLYRGLVTVWDNPESLVRNVSEPRSILDDPLLNVEDHAAARMMAQDMRSYLPDDILCKVDRAAMGVSLETRVPFLDPDVIAIAAQLPMDMKIRGNNGKWALRQLLYRHVPRELIERPKTGFGIPIGDWLRGPLRDWAEALLAPEKLGADDLLDPEPILKIWVEHLSGRRDWSNKLWTVLMLQAWRERWQ